MVIFGVVMVDTKIISAFPGTGKSYFHQNTGLQTLDSDSSTYSWVSKGVRNPDFPNNYISHIRDNIGSADVILVSSHKEVRDALVNGDIHYTLAYPDRSLKDEYVERFRQRGSPDTFVELVSTNWDNWISELEAQKSCDHIRLSKGQYLSDVL